MMQNPANIGIGYPILQNKTARKIRWPPRVFLRLFAEALLLALWDQAEISVWSTVPKIHAVGSSYVTFSCLAVLECEHTYALPTLNGNPSATTC